MIHQVIESFNDAAPSYLEHATIQAKVALWLSEYITQDPSGASLELGAGPGLFTKYLLPSAKNLTASDASVRMVELGKKHYPDLHWKVCDVREPLQGLWNNVYSCSMLQWIENPESVFQNIRRILKKDGKLQCSLFIEGTLKEWISVAQASGPLTWRTSQTWRKSITQSGLTILKDRVIEETLFMPSALACLKSLHLVGAAPKRMYSPAALRERMKDYDRLYRTSRGVPVTWVCYQFVAVNA